MNHAIGSGSRPDGSAGGACHACGVATHRRLLRALLPPLTIALVTLTAAALFLAATLLVPSRSATTSVLVRPVVARALRTEAASTILGQIARMELPRTPAVVDLARLIYAPGDGGSHRALLGPMLLIVESGALAVQLDGEAQLLRDEGVRTVTGNDLVLQPGDGLVLPRLTPAAFRNSGTVPAVALGAGVFQSGVIGKDFGRVGLASWNEAWSPGATIQPLAGGWLGASTARIAALTVQRWILPAGASLPLSAHGPVDLAVETGSLTLEARTGLVWHQPPRGANQYIDPASTVTLLPGDAALLQNAAEVTLRNDGTGPLAILALSVDLDLDDPVTPHVAASLDLRAERQASSRLHSSATSAPYLHALEDIGASQQSAWDEANPRAFLARMTASQHRHGLPLPDRVNRLQILNSTATPFAVPPCHPVTCHQSDLSTVNS